METFILTCLQVVMVMRMIEVLAKELMTENCGDVMNEVVIVMAKVVDNGVVIL